MKMAIYTRMGSKVTPLEVPTQDGWIKVRREDGSEREYHVSELRCDTDDESLFLNGQTRMLRGAL
jgi:hypothetical protein